MSKDRLIKSNALAANCVTILGLLLVIIQLRQNRSLMRAQVRHELASTIVDLLSSTANNSQLASVVRRGGIGEQLTDDEQPFSDLVEHMIVKSALRLPGN